MNSDNSTILVGTGMRERDQKVLSRALEKAGYETEVLADVWYFGQRSINHCSRTS